MKFHQFLTFCLFVSKFHLLAQNFVGVLNYQDRNNKATLQIKHDSSFVMVCQNDSNSFYKEFYGYIQNQGGENYTLNIVGGFEKLSWPSTQSQYSLVDHKMYVDVDTSLIRLLNPIYIRDPYGKKHDYDLHEKPSLWLNKVPRQPYHYVIYTNKKDTITGKLLSFTGYSNNLTLFRKHGPMSLPIKISKGNLITIKPKDFPAYYYYNLQLKMKPSKK
jgi:hypothetical protein